MSLNQTPAGERIHIGFFGMVNAGKSSLVNKVTNQELSVVSDLEGTTTDVVKKNMELLPLGAVTIIDCPGFGDNSEIGEKRMKMAENAVNFTDIGILAVDSNKGMSKKDIELTELFKSKNIPFVIAYSAIGTKTSSRYFVKRLKSNAEMSFSPFVRTPGVFDQ